MDNIIDFFAKIFKVILAIFGIQVNDEEFEDNVEEAVKDVVDFGNELA